jgi:hypothetical protein
VFPNGRVIEEHNTSPLDNISPAGSFILAFTNITDNSSLADFALTAQHVWLDACEIVPQDGLPDDALSSV